MTELTISAIQLLFALILGHFVADFALQSDSMAKGKSYRNRPRPPPGQKFNLVWPYWLSAHAGVHASAVWLVTSSPLLGLLEFGAHWVTDYAKCRNWTNIHIDQALHFGAKMVWVTLWLAWR